MVAKQLIHKFFLAVIFLLNIVTIRANNIAVSNVTVTGQNTSAGANNVANFSLVQFNLSWENSWRVGDGPANWDAAWVFVKFRVGASNPTFTGVSSSGTTVTVSSTTNLRVGMPVRVSSGTGAFAANSVISSITNTTQFVVSATPTTPLSGASIECIRIWEHARLNNTGHTAPSGSTIDPGLLAPGSAFNATTNPAVGVFLYRNAAYDGSNTFNNVQLRWNYGINGINDTATVNLQVFAIEMVYVPQGSFSVGGGTVSSRFARARSSDNASFQITATPPTIQGYNAASLATNLGATGNMDLTSTTTAALATGYPTGFNAFYAMKYEITQGQYRDFLNTLTRTQQANRVGTNISVGTTAVTNRFVMSNNSTTTNIARNGIRCNATIDANNPITFYCDLNNNGTGNEAADGEWIACNWLSWQDGAAYMDWACLRPMTELEFEKACRGPLTPVDGEYAWGTPSIAGLLYTLSGTGSSTEGINTNYNTSGGNAVTSTTWGSIGPLRVGIFAANANNSGRITSGATYYGIMEMSGNVVERAVTLANVAGRSYTGLHGNGSVFIDGSADVDFWPGINGNTDPNSVNTTFGGVIGVSDAAGSGLRGGSANQSTQARVADRGGADFAPNFRANNYGYRGARSAQ